MTWPYAVVAPNVKKSKEDFMAVNWRTFGWQALSANFRVKNALNWMNCFACCCWVFEEITHPPAVNRRLKTVISSTTLLDNLFDPHRPKNKFPLAKTNPDMPIPPPLGFLFYKNGLCLTNIRMKNKCKIHKCIYTNFSTNSFFRL